MTFSDEAISGRRTAYALCFAEVANKRRIARSVGDLDAVTALEHRMHLLWWARQIMLLYPLSTETCNGQYIPDYDTVCCAMKLADPCCAYCECAPTPQPPPFDCTITPNYTAIPVDVSFYSSAVPGVTYFIVSNSGSIANPWSSEIGSLVVDTTFTPVADLEIVEDPNTGDFWTMGGGTPGPLYPVIDMVEVVAGDYVLISQYPNINGSRSRNVLVEGSVDGVTWESLYEGDEAVLADPFYVSGTAGMTQIRIIYRFGLCSDGPFSGTVTQGELLTFVTTSAGATVAVTFRSSTGYIRVRDWSGNEFVFGAGNPALDIVTNIPIPTTGPFSGNANKPVYAWPVTSPSAIVPSGSITRFVAGSSRLVQADLTRTDGIVLINVANNQLTALPMSPASSPTSITCNNNQLATLVIPGSALTSLVASSNLLTTIDLSAHTGLLSCTLSNNLLTSLDVSANTLMTSLSVNSNQLPTLDVSANVALTLLNAANNLLGSISVANNVLLTDLYLNNNTLGSIDVSLNTALLRFYINNNLLASLDVSTNVALLDLRCNNNALGTLDVSNNVLLQTLHCYSCSLTTLDVSVNTALVTLLCYTNALTALDITLNTALVTLDCGANDITAIDPTNCTLLQSLSVYGNELTTLDVTANTALRTLLAQDNDLSAIDVSNCTLLTNFQVSNNPVGTLTLTSNTALQILYANSCGLTALSVPSTALQQLQAQNNDIATLDVSGKPQLASLLVGNNVNMTSLNFANCFVQTLNIAGCVDLATVQGVNNRLNVASVDALFTPLVPATAGTVTINGGTNAAPTAASLVQRTALLSGGWTITTN